MRDGLLLILPLLAAIGFAGTVFFEVVMPWGVRGRLPSETMCALGRAMGERATAVMTEGLRT